MSDVRADDCQNEGAPRQIAAVVLTTRPLIPGCRPVTVSRVVAMTWTGAASTRACQDRDGNECANEEKIKKDPEPAEPFGTTTSQDKRQQH